MTAAELYATDAGFRGFLAVWDQNRRCPLELVDYLLDRGMESQAECARWAATEPDREVYNPKKANGEREGNCGPYPGMSGDAYWYWLLTETTDRPHRVPRVSVGEMEWGILTGDSPEGAMVTLMDAWIAEPATFYEQPKYDWTVEGSEVRKTLKQWSDQCDVS